MHSRTRHPFKNSSNSMDPNNFSSYDDEIGNALSNQRETMLDDIHSQVGHLKNIATGISEETRRSRQILSRFDQRFDDTSSLLDSTIDSMRNMISNGTTQNSCYLALFIVFVVLLLWWIYSFTTGPDNTSL